MNGESSAQEVIVSQAVKSSHKDAAVDFMRLVASGNVREAYRKHVAPGFRHHNPFFKGDAESLMAAMAENAAQNPEKILEIQRALQEDDLVAVHSRVRQKPGDRGGALVHVFRFEGNRIAELWDVGQAVPENCPNEHGMF
jgi:predicted SnoaL-like aldol condensation-catalyzing enzyme